MSEIKFETKNDTLNYSGKENSMVNSSKENFSSNKSRNNKTTTKLLFSVFKNQKNIEKKEDKKEEKTQSPKNKGNNNNNLKNNLNDEENNKINNSTNNKEKNEHLKNEENCKNEQKIVLNNIQQEKLDENKNSVTKLEKDIINKNIIINNNSPPPIIYSNPSNINNEKNNSPPPIINSISANPNIVNSNSPPPMINNNSINTNIINNTINNSIINNNYNIRYNDLNNNNSNNIKYNDLNNNNSNNINNSFNNMNYGFNHNFPNDLSFKENNINKNNNFEKNNMINNLSFKRGQSIPNKLNRNTYFNNTPHLLENAIINNQFEPPKRKVILKDEKYPSPNFIGNNNPYISKNYQKIINLDESDSENFFYSNNHEEDKISQDFDDDDFKDDDNDEDYHVNNSESKLSKRKKVKISPFPSKKDLDSILYEELNNLIKKNTFIKIVDYLSKYYKNELKANPDQKEENEIIEKINDILSKNNKNSVNLTLIYILSNNYRESQIKLMDLINLANKKQHPLEIKENIKERIPRRGKSQKLISNTDLLNKKRKHTKKPSPPFYYGKHFHKIHDKIYTYVPKAKTGSLNRYTLYCMYRAKNECMAKMIVHQNDNKISIIGSHICTPKLTVEDFYKKYPYISKEPDWTHIQFAVENEKPYILSRF